MEAGAAVDVSGLVEVGPQEKVVQICALTGAGISVAAGLRTFRGPVESGASEALRVFRRSLSRTIGFAQLFRSAVASHSV